MNEKKLQYRAFQLAEMVEQFSRHGFKCWFHHLERALVFAGKKVRSNDATKGNWMWRAFDVREDDDGCLIVCNRRTTYA